MSAWIFVGLLGAAIVLSVATPAPPTAGGTATLDYIAAHRTLYMVHQPLWWVPGVFARVTYLVLYPALKHLDGACRCGPVWRPRSADRGHPALAF